MIKPAIQGMPRTKICRDHGRVFVKLFHPTTSMWYGLWTVGAVPMARKFVVNWHPSHRYDQAVFRSKAHARGAILENLKLVEKSCT